MDVRITRRVDKLPGLGSALRRESQRFSDETARDVLKRAQSNIVSMGAVDTGAMHDSGSVQAAGQGSHRVVFTVEYALYVHEGHRTRGTTFVPGRPFLTTAIEDARAGIPQQAAMMILRAVG
jgi:hypothetical protein